LNPFNYICILILKGFILIELLSRETPKVAYSASSCNLARDRMSNFASIAWNALCSIDYAADMLQTWNIPSLVRLDHGIARCGMHTVSWCSISDYISTVLHFLGKISKRMTSIRSFEWITFVQALIFMVSFDLLGTIMRWRYLDHSAHLGGVLFGM
jgi:hypothetical protein